MTYQLRPYQSDLLDRVAQSWGSNRRVMLQLPTGGGKTICFSHVVAQFITAGKTVLILAHREELIKQAADKITTITGIEPGIIKAGYKPDYFRRVQVASVQSLTRRLAQCPHFDLIIIDESHHSVSTSYRSILAAFPTAQVLGVTATPIRLDGSGFRDLFDDLICGVTVRELIEMGSLSPYKYFAPEKSMSLIGVRKRGGDFRPDQIEEANPPESVAADCLKAYRDYLESKSAVVFAVSIAHSIAIAASFSACGIPAAHLDGNSDPATRSQTMEAFRAGRIRVLTNCALFDEGLDIPDLDGVILARPTASLGRYLQMVGRALRPSPTKDHATIIDIAGNWERHGLPDDERLWSLDGVETKKRPRTKQLERQPNGEIEEVTVDLTPSDIQLKEVTRAELDEWRNKLNHLILTQQSNGYQPYSLVYKLMKLKAPLEVWQMLAKHLGYKRGWAWHRFQEQQTLQQVLELSA